MVRGQGLAEVGCGKGRHMVVFLHPKRPMLLSKTPGLLCRAGRSWELPLWLVLAEVLRGPRVDRQGDGRLSGYDWGLRSAETLLCAAGAGF